MMDVLTYNWITGILVRASILLILLLGCGSEALAREWLYPAPPSPDTSLLAAPPLVVSQTVTRTSIVKHSKHHTKISHRQTIIHSQIYHAVKKPFRHGELTVAFALAAPACCGETWVLHGTNCCVTWGVWGSSRYGSFHVDEDDMTYSPTNDDDTRGDVEVDRYRVASVEEVVEDPEY
jgi:hypothetical protein